ncbi:phosphate ABC transporter substrate-binding protein [Bacillus sp. MUM 116]|uniref:Phosphate ABC transporter substrate-binding protein n=1 Tax=Bacillus xiapuensis TaxID=2014075 RepID=A0ABU6N5X1_9BACI|nr:MULTISPECIES: phosphate ABC transporter substrate-binding protein [Bacillus]MED3561617.1 phosphate ABC transporter substrate-binding protein [Bacillus xiapuensis]OIK16350.1 phosphate ABC transporter substrate-binding protein [Bacillus sp. MUM 116]
MNLFKRISMASLALAATVGLSLGSVSTNANAASVSGKVVVAGSTALLPLTQQAASEFKKLNPRVSISVSGSSSIAGPQSVSRGSATIGACDWDATQPVKGFSAFKGLKANKIAVIPFATIVNKANPVKNLTTSQLQGIFSGKITNWKQVGGKNAEIVVVNRKNGSGTRVNYQKKALKNVDFMKSGNYKEVGKSGEMAAAVNTNPNAIGYIDFPYIKGNLKAVSYNGVAATTENVMNGKYPVWGYGYLLTKGNPTGANAAFIKYVQSSKFQNGSLKKLKFIPINKMK